MLTFFPAGVLPDTGALLNGAWVNDDGHGFAVVAGDQVITQHGMNAEAMVEAFNTVRCQHPNGPALFHSRLCTHGEISLDNCHPFPIGGDHRSLLAHNGVLPMTVQPTKGDTRSDTRITAEDFLPTFGSLRSRRNRLRFQRWMNPNNKIVILTADPRFKRNAYILNEKSGIWDAEIWYSSRDYLPLPPNRWGWPDDPQWAWPSPDHQPNRHAGRCCSCDATIPVAAAACPYCGWCLDCFEMPHDCLCYTPGNSAHRAASATGSPATR